MERPPPYRPRSWPRIEPLPSGDDREQLVHALGERVKELTCLHQAASILNGERLEVATLLARVAALLPPAFQYPEITDGEIRYGSVEATTASFQETPWMLDARFRTANGTDGMIRVVYHEHRPEFAEGPFLVEERRLLDSLAEMLETALDRRNAQDGLERSQTRLEMALAAAGTGIWEWDIRTNAVTWSTELEQIAGLTPGTFAGTYEAFDRMLEPDDRAAMDAAIRSAFEDQAERDAFHVNFRLVRADGDTRWLVSSGRLLRDADGAPLRMLGTVQDLTDFRRLEQQLQQSQKMEAMGQLAGGVAHDFNNLLTAIRGYSEFVIEGLPADDRRRADVEEILAAADRAAQLTKQLLAFSRRQVLAPRILDPNAVVAGMEKLLRRIIGADIEVQVSLTTLPIAIRIDPGQLEQVVMNLAVNARDAMPRGGRLSIETDVRELDEQVGREVGVRAGRYAVIAVHDTGVGMTAETRAHIFEPFFTTKERGRGTGLGLATVYGVVTQSAGAIRVESEVGRGTTFRIFLPWERGTPERGPAAPFDARSLRGTETIVFVDDDPQVRALAERALRAQGYRVLACATSAEVLAHATSPAQAIDILVTDIVMPGMQGPEIVARVRAAQPRARVLFVTGYAERAADRNALAGETVLSKPFTPAGLVRSVRQVLDATSSRP